MPFCCSSSTQLLETAGLEGCVDVDGVDVLRAERADLYPKVSLAMVRRGEAKLITIGGELKGVG